MLSPSEITALIKMLDDPDETIAEKIISQLEHSGKETIILMHQIWETNLLEIVDDRILEIENRIKLNTSLAFFTDWQKSENPKVLEAWLFIASLFDPNFDGTKVFDSINKIRFDIWVELNDSQTTIEKCKIMARIFEEKHKIHVYEGAEVPSTSYLISSILSEKQSSRSGITILYQHIAALLEIDLFGLNFFEYAVLGYFNPNAPENRKRADVLFYLIFAEKIHLIGNNQLDLGLEIDNKSLYTPVNQTQIIHKLLFGLQISFLREHLPHNALICKSILEILS